MRGIKVGAAQFEARDADKAYNLDRIANLTRRGTEAGAEIISFHECCVTGYTFLMTLPRVRLEALAEPVPDGPSTRKLIEIAKANDVAVLAGLVESEDGRLYNTYVAVTAEGFVARHRKIHTFISKFLTPGNEYTVFDLCGCRVGILTCYDNNLPENVRITATMGAEIVFMPHVTCGLESVMPGRGKIDRKIWENRHRDPVRCRQEFEGPKGRGWLMRWLPTRAYENGVYAVFSNAIGLDHDTVKTGNAMCIDPFGEILVESHALEDDVVVGFLSGEKIPISSGYRYLRARRPELYGRLVETLPEGMQGGTHPGWRMDEPKEKRTGGQDS